jgi:hypothetical protein
MPAPEDGSVLWLGWPGLALVAVALLLITDLAAYVIAAERAQGAADAAALAAVAVSDPRGGIGGPPRSVAARVARAAGTDILDCVCPDGAEEVEVRVSAQVRAIAVTRFAGGEVEAVARARLVPDETADDATSRRAGARPDAVPPDRSPRPDGR